MSLEKAVSSFTGQNGVRMNCAQSVLNGFKEEFNISDGKIAEFQKYGGGRAPGGLCGAFYAAKTILEKNNGEEKLKELEKEFMNCAGSTKCREIKMGRGLSCQGCVEKSSKFLDSVLKSSKE